MAMVKQFTEGCESKCPPKTKPSQECYKGSVFENRHWGNFRFSPLVSLENLGWRFSGSVQRGFSPCTPPFSHLVPVVPKRIDPVASNMSEIKGGGGGGGGGGISPHCEVQTRPEDQAFTAQPGA